VWDPLGVAEGKGVDLAHGAVVVGGLRPDHQGVAGMVGRHGHGGEGGSAGCARPGIYFGAEFGDGPAAWVGYTSAASSVLRNLGRRLCRNRRSAM
jgi:hypothetical protein